MALLDALLPAREQRLLRALVLRPEQSYSVNELSRIGGDSKSASVAIIDRFVATGLVSEERVGNQRRLRFNRHWPLADELRSMCVKSFGVAEPLRKALAPLLDQVQLAFVFGSVAKGTDHAGSDIDLMVVGELTSRELMEVLYPLEQLLGRPVNFNLYSPAEWTHVQADRVISSIVSGPKVIIHEKADSAEPAEPPATGLPPGGTGAGLQR